MYTLLLTVIYVSFISLGLPDSLLGSAWPSMYGELHVPVSYAGIISMIIAGGTILSSLASNTMIKKLGTGLVTAVSVAMTALALFGFSFSHSFAALCLWAIPYGLGAGSVDAALNNFVALHYKSRHMSWLHCFWGIGASLGPYIMGYCLTGGLPWGSGYRVIAVLQAVLTACLLLSLPFWKTCSGAVLTEESAGEKSGGVRDVLRRRGSVPVLIAFLCYCTVESTAGLWASSYMVMAKGIAAETPASRASLFYLGITAGRFICGFLTMKLSDKNMIRLGQAVAGLGLIFFFLPLGTGAVPAGLILIGLGCAPIYPSLLHATPETFGAHLSQAAMGLQMACAYIGSTFGPPVFSLLVSRAGIKPFPFYLAFFVLLMAVMLEGQSRRKRQNAGTAQV